MFFFVNIGPKKTFEANDFEELPVELVNVQESTQLEKGDKHAPVKETKSPPISNTPAIVPDAKNVGNNRMDFETPPTDLQHPVEVKSSAPPKSPDVPLPKNEEIVSESKEEEQKLASLPQKNLPQEAKIPSDTIPLPNFRDDMKPSLEKPVEKETEAKKNITANDKSTLVPNKEGKRHDKKTIVKDSSPKKSDFDAKQISALLNKQDSSGGGASRSTETPSLGNTIKSKGSKLSQSEMDLLRGQIAKNWNIVPGLEGLEKIKIRVRFHLDRDGFVIGEPEVEATGGVDTTRQILASGARRAIIKSQPFHLPPDKYDDWSYVIVNFQPSDIM
ncbi:cell envelope integrity protein TolA [Liberibacter crescens]|uniref:cell envelope integrity protein TolA n=1 Tax=Liberibacter crescens TaxID=1273132 RepID=UPI00030A2846|nr:cell envelope integrity protein TolA [Liberibacter crescens]